MLTCFRLVNMFFALAFWSCTIRSTAEEPRQSIDPANIIEKFDVARDGNGLLLLPVMIRNKKYSFVLDTGAGHVIYDVSFKSILGKPKKTQTVSTPAGSAELETFESPEAFLGRNNLQSAADVVTSDLSRFRDKLHTDIYGVIGTDFLKRHIIQIDFDKGEVLFLRSVSSKAGQALRLSFQNHVPVTQLSFPGCECKEEFIVDTGLYSDDDSGNMRRELYRLLEKKKTTKVLPGVKVSYTLAGKVANWTTLRLNTLSLGPFTHSNLIFSTSHTCSNAVGLGFLSRYVVTFDFPHKIMYLRKGKMFDIPDCRDRSGLSIGRNARKTVVTDVALFSPAWWSGIRPKDEILKIESVQAKGTSLFALRRLLGMGEKKVHLALQRGSEHIEVSVLLRIDPDKVQNSTEEARKDKDIEDRGRRKK